MWKNIIGAIVGAVVGAVVGGLTGGIPGAIVGGIIGGIAGWGFMNNNSNQQNGISNNSECQEKTITISNQTSTTLTINWTHQLLSSYYKVYHKKKNFWTNLFGIYTLVGTYNEPTHSATITGLQNNKTYVIKVTFESNNSGSCLGSITVKM